MYPEGAMLFIVHLPVVLSYVVFPGASTNVTVLGNRLVTTMFVALSGPLFTTYIV